MTNIELIKSIITEYGAEQVILFGSRAFGKADKFSDYDVLAIFNSKLTQKKKFQISSEFRKKMAENFIDVDILLKSKADIENRKNQIGSVIRAAINEGVIL